MKVLQLASASVQLNGPFTSPRWSPNMTSVGIFASVASCAAVRCGIAAYFNRDDSLYAGRIDQRGLFRKEAGLRVSDEDGAMQLHAQRRHLRQGWIETRRQRRVQIRNHLLVKLVDRLQWELLIGEPLTIFWSEPEDGPGELMGRVQDPGHLGVGSRARAHLIECARIESRTGPGNLIGQVHRAMLAHEVFAPAHASIGSRFPGLAAQTAAVHEDDGDMPRALQRDLVLHVHLVDRDFAALRRRRSGGRFADRALLATHEEAALLLDGQGTRNLCEARKRRHASHDHEGPENRRAYDV